MYLSAAGLALDIIGFSILFFNGNFTRNFNRLDGFSVFTSDANGKGGGMRAIEKKDIWPKILEYLGFSLVILGFSFQLAGNVLSE
jgi:hypothetical protein